ncbi:MAG: DUF4019 domain-containing protein [Pedosphaera sp.]|nr:DUF4019 domain-containing protein [Pedosphaera sp.]
MKMLLLPLAFVVFLFATPPGLRAAPQSHEQAGRAAAEEWLALVDAGKFAESWQKLDPAFGKKVGKRKWTSGLNAIRGPLGKLTLRTLKSAEYTKELSGAPEGEYVVVQFTAAFERKKEATEKVTLILGRDLFWRVAGYSVK